MYRPDKWGQRNHSIGAYRVDIVKRSSLILPISRSDLKWSVFMTNVRTGRESMWSVPTFAAAYKLAKAMIEHPSLWIESEFKHV